MKIGELPKKIHLRFALVLWKNSFKMRPQHYDQKIVLKSITKSRVALYLVFFCVYD